MIPIASSLEDIRKQKHLTQIDMAKKLGIAVSTYNQYENGQRCVPYEKATLIAGILGVNINDIFLPTRFTISKTQTGK